MHTRLEVLPEALLRNAQCRVILSSRQGFIVHKQLSLDLCDVGVFVQSPMLLFVLSGQQVIRDVHGESIRVRHGHLVHIPVGVYQVSDYVTDDAQAFEALVFAYPPALLQAFAHQVDLSSSPGNSIAVARADATVHAQLRALIEVYGSLGQANKPDLLQIKLLELLHLLRSDICYASLLGALTSACRRQRRSIGEVMAQHADNRLSVADFAVLCGMSEATFVRTFKRLYGQTPKKWLIRRRLEAAHELLATQMSVQDVALEVGYDSVSHFIRAYKGLYQITPKQGQMTELHA